MIKLFRNIRRRLLRENRFTRYLIYAIGEIILVVIGILTALQINNWNEQENKITAEKKYLQSLEAEFQTNLSLLDQAMETNIEILESVEALLNLFNPDELAILNERQLSEKIYMAFSRELSYKPSNGVFQDIINSGNLNLIRNENLRRELASFNSTIELYKAQEDEANRNLAQLRDYLNNNGSLRKIIEEGKNNPDYNSVSSSFSNKTLFESIEFENEVMVYILLLRSSNGQRYYGALKAKIEHIVNALRTELKSTAS